MPSCTFPFCTSHHQNSVSLTLCAHFQYFKKPSSLLSNFLSNSFLSSLCSVSGCNMTFRLCFFQPDFLFCHVSLHSVVLNILLCPPFSMVHPTTISLPLPPPLAFLFLSYSCFVFPLNVIFSHYFFLPVLSLYSSVSVSWTLLSSLLHISLAKYMRTFGLFVFSSVQGKGKMTCSDILLPGQQFLPLPSDLTLAAVRYCKVVVSSTAGRIMSYNPDCESSLLCLLAFFLSWFCFSLRNFIIPHC